MTKRATAEQRFNKIIGCEPDGSEASAENATADAAYACLATQLSGVLYHMNEAHGVSEVETAIWALRLVTKTIIDLDLVLGSEFLQQYLPIIATHDGENPPEEFFHKLWALVEVSELRKVPNLTGQVH